MKKMKYPLLATILLMSESTTVRAEDYVQNIITCHVTADSATLSNPVKTNLPWKPAFTLSVVNPFGSKRILRSQQIGESLLSVPAVKRLSKYEERFSLDFGTLSASESREILMALGASNVPALPHGFELGRLRNMKNCGANDNGGICNYAGKKVQIRFSPDENDGLTYHLYVRCVFEKQRGPIRFIPSP